ncbi:hypothetical protein GCM10008018_08700 [Paenibacillus marchantiophytorum]|uniref:Uncharacterized protein n=1 Tax=Paenibacillus marchantiophytorum TaxID=1619310 RepID=A0ABQ2BPT8_9BACL|nr:hypothetical protein GCM10008018_08700 [Paenibacillus marchantiophytorum]
MSTPAGLRLTEEVYHGQWHSLGKHRMDEIRSDQVRIPIRWLSGINTIRAEVMSKEGMFGWGA